MLFLGRLITTLFSVGALLFLAASGAQAAALCTPAGGGVAVEMDPGGTGLQAQTCNGDLAIQAGGVQATMVGSGTLVVTGNMVIEPGASLLLLGATEALTIIVDGNFTVATGGVLNGIGGSGLANVLGIGAGNTPLIGPCPGSGAGGGGGGGNAGRSFSVVTLGGIAYGSVSAPSLPGSRGGDSKPGNSLPATLGAGGQGGAAVRLIIAGTTTLDGLITVDGAAGITGVGGNNRASGGGGSGGSILLRTGDLLTNAAGVVVRSVGGRGGPGYTGSACTPGGANGANGGGGGGGRIAIYYTGQNGPVGNPALNQGLHVSCVGGLRGTTPHSLSTDGIDGTCIVAPALPPPVVISVSPSVLGQGASNVAMSLSGSGFVAGSALTFDGAAVGFPANGLTVSSVAVASPTLVTFVLSVDPAASALPANNPRSAQVRNPDTSISAATPVFTVAPAPVITTLESGGSPITQVDRGASLTLVVVGSNFDSAAQLTFSPPLITATGVAVVNGIGTRITVPVKVSEQAVVGSVAVSVQNGNLGRSLNSLSLTVLSNPILSQITPPSMVVGELSSVVLTGSGFVAGAQINVSGTGVTIQSVQFDSFTQLTAVISVSIDANLIEQNPDPTFDLRNLTVDNNDGGVSAPLSLRLEAPPAGITQADLIYAEVGVSTPLLRRWNGFGWGSPTTSLIPHKPEWIVSQSGRVTGESLVASLAGGTLYLQERLLDAGQNPIWQAPSGAISVVNVAGSKRVVDVAPVSGVLAERYLVAYGTAAGLSYQVIGGPAAPGNVVASGSIPRTNPDCGGGNRVRWVRTVANAAGTEALVVYLNDNRALCAIVWNAGTAAIASSFDAASEQLLIGANGLLSTNSMGFDATYWGVPGSQKAMVAWAVSGDVIPGVGHWDGTAWTMAGALTASSSSSDEIIWLRLAAASNRNLVALVNATSSGDLFGQIWGGTRWGETFAQLSAPLLSDIDHLSYAGDQRPFDVVWSGTFDEATVVYGIQEASAPVIPPALPQPPNAAPRSRRWTEATGWGGVTVLGGGSDREEIRWVSLTADPGGGDILAAVVDERANASSDDGTLRAYYWNGIAWQTGRDEGVTLPVDTEAADIAYRFSLAPPAPTVITTISNGTSPAAIGATATNRTIDVSGTGFLNVPAVTFIPGGVTVNNVRFLSSQLVRVTVDIGDIAPGSYTLELTNPGGTPQLLSGGLQVLERPNGIQVSATGVGSCTPVGAASGCVLQDTPSVALEVRGRGIVSGAVASFAASGIDYISPPAFSFSGPPANEGILTGLVSLAGNATPGLIDVTVTNPDSSSGTAAGELEIRSSTRVDSVSLGAVVAPQLGQGAVGVLLTLRGQNLQEGAVFEFVPTGDIIVRDVLSVSVLEAVVTVDLLPFATLGGRKVKVTNPDGGTFVSTVDLLSVIDGLSVFSLSPSGVPQGQLTSVTASGSRLDSVLNASQVLVSGAGVTVSNVRNTTATSVTFDLTVAIDADFSAPRVLTLVRDTGGQARTLLNIEPVPVITGVNPGQLTSGELNRSVSITGTGFDPAAVVLIVGTGGQLINQSVLNTQAINIVVDTFAPATGVDLAITNPNGQTSPVFTLPLGVPLGLDLLVGEIQTLDATVPLSLDHITLDGGAVLTLQGDVVVNVINNVDIINGTLVIDSANNYVRLRVGGDLIVGAAGSIDASGTGFIGAKLQPGVNGKVNLAQGPGAGSNSDKFVNDGRRKNSGTGGGNGGAGGDAFFPGKGGHTYDVLNDDCPPVTCFAGVPLRPGSGGGAGYETARYWHEGGDGGGAVVLEIQGNATIDGSILADGTNGAFSATDGIGDVAPGNPTKIKGAGGGAGGSIMLLVGQNGGVGVGNISGSNLAVIRAKGGNASSWAVPLPGPPEAAGSGAGGGRIAIYYSGTNTFAGSVTTPGGTSPFSGLSYPGVAGTTIVQPLTALNNYTPDGAIQGSTNFPVTLGGANVVVGDTVLFQSPLLTGGTVTAPGLTVPVSVDSSASVGRYTVMLRHADQSGGIVFDRFPVAPVPLARGLVPNRMAQDAVVAVDLNASFLEVAGTTVEFLRGGVAQPVTATINAGTSTDAVLKLTVTAAAGAPLGSYDVRLRQDNGGSFVLTNGFTVTSPGGTIPAVSRVQLPEAGPGLSAIRAQVLGYDFGIPGAFNVTGISTNPGVSMRFASGGCPGVATDPPALRFVGCEPNPAAEQHLDVLFDTTVVTSGLVDVTVTGAAGSSTVVGGIRINPAPVIATVVPDRGQEAFIVTVTGTNLLPGATISLDDPQIQVGVTTVNNGVLTATVTVPTDIATSVTTLRVTNADGGVALFTPWTGNPQPIVASLSPTEGLKPGLTGTFTITGENFISDAAVDLGSGVAVLNITVVDSTQIQITVQIDSDAVVGPRDVVVTNRSNRPSGVLLNGFGVGPKLILQSVTPSVVGVGGGTTVSGRSGVTLLLGGQGMSSDLSLHDISFSAEGVERLSSANNLLDGSTPDSLSHLSNFRSIDVGGTTVTSGQMQIRVVSGTDVGVGTITLENPDGTQASHPFTVTPAPVISQVTPSAVIRGTQVDLSISGFNFDTINPRVCIGDDCDRGLGDAGVRILSVQPQTPNLLIATVFVESDAPTGSHAITIANKDRGRKTRSSMLEVTSGFTVDARTAVAVNVGASLADSMSGQDFSGTPQVLFLNADGSVDSTIQTSGVSASSTSVSYSVAVGATTLPGMRAVRVINGDGAVAERSNFLLVSNGVGPTAGAILVSNSANRLGLIGWMPRIAHNIQLLGKGFTAVNLALSFDRAGLVVSNMSVVDDSLVTFSLTMPSDTIPGAAAVTVTSAAGQDTLADALIIGASPVLSSTQPAVVTSGTTAASMLINGGNIDRDVRVVVPTAGITLRDFDIAPGNQPAWIASNLVRVVYDAAATTSGTMELQLVNEDGGMGRILVPIEAPARHGDAVVAYLAGVGTNGLEVRDWAGVEPIRPALQSNPASTQLPHSAAFTDYQLKLHSNPVNPGEYMLAVARYKDQNFQPHLLVYRRAPGSTDWNEVFRQGELTTAGGFVPEWHGHPFDIAYEQAGAGAGLVVYGSGPGLSFIRLQPGVADVSDVVSIGGVSPNASGRPLWVRLIPQKGSQRILVMYITHNMEVQAIIWDGAAGASGAFISQFDVNGPGSLLTDNAAQGPSNADSVEFVKASFDGAWETQSGRAVAFWGVNQPDNLEAATWDPASGWAGPFVQPDSSVAVPAGRGPTFLEAKASPAGNLIVVAGAFFNRPTGSRALTTAFWDGDWLPDSGTMLSNRIGLGASSQFKSARNFDLEWESPTRIVALYPFVASRFGTFRSAIQYSTWEADGSPRGVWQIGADLPIFDNVRSLQSSVDISKDPESDDMLAVVVVDDGISITSAPKVQSTLLFQWNGFGWSVPELLTDVTTNHQLGATRPGQTDLVNHFGRTGTVAYRTDAAAPAAVTLSQVGEGSTNATIQWTVPGDNGATDGQAGGYDIRWSSLVIVDDDATVQPGEIRFSDANQVTDLPLPGTVGTTQQAVVDFGAVGSYSVALKTGDRPSLKQVNGQESLRVNVSALSNVLTAITLAADPVPPEAVTDLAAVAGANPESMVQLSWTGVGDDAGVPANGPVRAYDLRISTLDISEVGGNNNFFIPFDLVTHTEQLTPAVDGTGGTRGVNNSFLVTGLTAGTTYYFAVKGEDEDATQYAPLSNVPSLRTASAVPSAISDLVVSSRGQNALTLSWTVPSGSPVGYEVRVAPTPIVDDNAVADCAVLAGQVCFSLAQAVLHPPTPVAAGLRQSFTVTGLAPGQVYYMAVVPVRYESNNGVLIQLAPPLALAFATTLTDPGINPTQPSAVSDLSVIAGTVRDDAVGLRWTAPLSPEGSVQRYEIRWSALPLDVATAAEIHSIQLPLLPSVTNLVQEFTLTDLPENARLYVTVVGYSRSGFASTQSNIAIIHTALRRGLNPISPPGALVTPDILPLLSPLVGSCVPSNTPTTGVGPVPACANGETPVVTAYRWDPTVNAAAGGDFVAIDFTDAAPDQFVPGEGIFVQAIGRQSVLDIQGLDQPSFTRVAIPNQNAGLMSNPYALPVLVSSLRIIGVDGGNVVLYNQPFATAVTDGVINPELGFSTAINGVLQIQPITASDMLLPFRAYFIQLGGTPNAALSYFVEVVHP